MDFQNLFRVPTQGNNIPLYYLYEMAHAGVAPARMMAKAARNYFISPLNPWAATPLGRSISAWAEVFERTTRRYGKPEFGHRTTQVDGKTVAVSEEIIWQRPFCNVIHFQRDLPLDRKPDQKLLIVAPMSGHYATLLRDTVATMLPHYEVYITDWADAREVPLSAGRFDLNSYIDYLIEIFRFLGRGTHAMAVCQPVVPVLAAATYMESMGDPSIPASMTLMGGPIDSRINPTAVNALAEDKGIDWFRDSVVVKVPLPHAGFMRDVYPGFLQLTGFMSMNLDRHIEAHHRMFDHLVQGDGESAEKHRDFYDEYLAVMDLTAEFYLQTVDEVFCKHSLPKGEFVHRGTVIDCSKVKSIAILTVEGERDDISGRGQTRAALDLCTSVPDSLKQHFEQPLVGHYGVFSGSRFRKGVAKVIQAFTAAHPEPGETDSSKVAALEAAVAQGTAMGTASARPASAPAPQAPSSPKRADADLAALDVSGGSKELEPITAPKMASDDLTQIKGVSDLVQKRLNALGVTQYAQIAGWNPEDISAIEKQLAEQGRFASGRIARDGWVSRAKELEAQ